MVLDLKWDTHICTIDKKFNQIINGLYRKQIMASQKMHLINVIASTVVEYGMSIVNYTTLLLWKIDIIMKKVVKHALQIRRDCPSNWLWTETKDRGMGLTCMENMQDAVFLGCVINQVLKGPDLLGQRAIINNMSCIRHIGEREVFTIKGVEDGGEGRRMPMSYRLITVARKYKLDLVLETKERKDDICNNLELPQEISKPMQLN